MKPSLSVFTLAHLAKELTEGLNRVPELSGDFTVRTVLSRGKLMVLAEHGASPQLQSEYVFAHVETLIRQRLESVGLPEEATDLAAQSEAVPIQIFLKHQTHRHPWAVHQFVWHLSDGFNQVFGERPLETLNPQAFEPALPDPSEPLTPTPVPDADEALAIAPPIEAHPALGNQTVPGADALPDQPQGDHPAETLVTAPPTDEELIAQAESLWNEAFHPEDLYGDSPEIAAVEEAAVFPSPPATATRPAWLKPRLLITGLLAVGVVGTLGYGITRPCVLGSCDRITKAKALGEAASAALSDQPSPQTVLDMRDQLKGATRQLRPIPAWSFHHDQAQELLTRYQQGVDNLDSVIIAQQEATAATEASQSPPYPIEDWQAVASQWQSAIDRLQTIDPNSPIYEELVAPKLLEYQANLATIEGRIAAEQAADASVNQAMNAAQIATKQTEIANTLAAWETALKSWENAVRQLKLIPQGTLAHSEAQKLLSGYEAELNQVRTRTRQERVADQFYNEALRKAAAARKSETENQWTLALMNWRDAVGQMQGIPPETVRYAESRTLLKTYQASLDNAQETLRLVMRFQKAEESFVKACGAGSQLCTYGIKAGKVQLTLANGYDDLIELSITPPDLRFAPLSASDQMIAQTNQLLSEITNIGKRTQLPIELYDAGGAFIARYNPELDGYVKH
jgi:hypothetical protein